GGRRVHEDRLEHTPHVVQGGRCSPARLAHFSLVATWTARRRIHFLPTAVTYYPRKLGRNAKGQASPMITDTWSGQLRDGGNRELHGLDRLHSYMVTYGNDDGDSLQPETRTMFAYWIVSQVRI